MNILVTGATGFIGKYFIKKLCASYKSITILTRSQKPIQRDNSIPSSVKTIYEANITKYSTIEKEFENIDLVIHLAGFVSFYQKDKERLLSINNKGSLNVLKACQKHNVKKIIHVSSTAALGFSDEAIDEDFIFDWEPYKQCIYSYSKYLPNKAIAESSINTTIVYPSLVLGPGDTTNTNKYIEAIQKNKIPFHMPGEISYIDVRDFVNALIFIIQNNLKNESIIITHKSYSFKQMNEIVAQTIQASSPKKVMKPIFECILPFLALIYEKIIPHPIISYENVFMSFKKRRLNNSKLSQLGFISEYSLDQTIKDSYQHMLNEKHL